jgi:hypothetical protein
MNMLLQVIIELQAQERTTCFKQEMRERKRNKSHPNPAKTDLNHNGTSPTL